MIYQNISNQFFDSYKETSIKISVVMPCFNEMHTVKIIIQKVLTVKLPFELELIIVDDCSADETRLILKKYETHDQIKLYFPLKRRGNSHNAP